MSTRRRIREAARPLLAIGTVLAAFAAAEVGAAPGAVPGAGAAPGPAGAAVPESHALERPRSHEDVLRASARERTVVVALFSTPGCPWCAALRADHLRHLAREQAAHGVRVVEYGLADHTPFAAPAHGVRSPAALAAALQVRVAPTVVFLGPDGGELAERLVGYASPDFYGAYLDRRIAQARERPGAP